MVEEAIKISPFHAPNWRKIAIEEKNFNTGDLIVNRVLGAIEKGGIDTDLELSQVWQLAASPVAVPIQCLRLGLAPLHIIAAETHQDPNTVDLYLKIFFDLEGVNAPLILTTIAYQDPTLSQRSLKVFSAKNGYKAFLSSYGGPKRYHTENVPSIEDVNNRLVVDVYAKLNEILISETGSLKSGELLRWAKLMSEINFRREDRAGINNIDSEEKIIKKLIGSVGGEGDNPLDIKNIIIIKKPDNLKTGTDNSVDKNKTG